MLVWSRRNWKELMAGMRVAKERNQSRSIVGTDRQTARDPPGIEVGTTYMERCCPHIPFSQIHEMCNGPFTLGRGDTRASSASPPVWVTATCASDRHPVIDEVVIHRHPASCKIGGVGASLGGQLSVLNVALDGETRPRATTPTFSFQWRCASKRF